MNRAKLTAMTPTSQMAGTWPGGIQDYTTLMPHDAYTLKTPKLWEITFCNKCLFYVKYSYITYVVSSFT
jgi:hypothetical protein